MPRSIAKAVEEDGPVKVDTLSSRGERCHIGGIILESEANCFRDALNLDPLRSRMALLLAGFPVLNRETEFNRLSRIVVTIRDDKINKDLEEAINATLPYERSYQPALLAFERILRLCRQDQAGSVSKETLNGDQVLETLQSQLPRAVARFLAALETGESEGFRKDLHRLDDVKVFLEEARALCKNGETFVECIMACHADIQRGKFDKGRCKIPWLEYVSRGRIALTSTREGGPGNEAAKSSDIIPHPYRLNSADALIAASRE